MKHSFRRWGWLWLCPGLWLSLTHGSFAGTVSQDYYEAGFAKVDITPTSAEMSRGGIFLGGYAPFRPAQSVHDRIFARAVAIAESGPSEKKGEIHFLAVAIVDAPGISNQSIRKIREKVAATTGLPPESILVGATHTHSGPDLQGLWGGVTDSYRGRLEAAVAGAIIQAYDSRAHAYSYVSETTHPNRNRRGWGVSDQDLTVLDFRKVSDDSRIGTVVNYAAHPVFINANSHELSRDYCGSVVDSVEKALGGTTVFVNGIVGDVTPGFDGTHFDGARRFGESVAQQAVASIPSQERISPALLNVSRTEWLQKVGNRVFEMAYSAGLLKYDMVKGSDGSLNLWVRTAYFRLGSTVQGILFPGESLTRNGLKIKESMRAPYRLFLGLTGDTLGYFVPSDEWETGHNNNYEESVCINKQVGDLARDRLMPLIEADPVY